MYKQLDECWMMGIEEKFVKQRREVITVIGSARRFPDGQSHF